MMLDPQTADALNKALDLARQGVVAAFETVRTYAPYVWSMARRQTLLEGVECAVGAGMSLVALAVAHWAVRPWAVRESEASGGFSYFPAVVLYAAAVVLFPVFVVNAIDLIGNPDYWTMMRILELVKH